MTARPWFGQSRVALALTAAWFCPFDDALALAHAVPGGSGTCFWLGTVMAESKGSYGFSSVEHRSLQAGEGIAVRGYPPPSATMIPGDSPQARGWGICPGATSLRTPPGVSDLPRDHPWAPRMEMGVPSSATVCLGDPLLGHWGWESLPRGHQPSQGCPLGHQAQGRGSPSVPLPTLGTPFRYQGWRWGVPFGAPLGAF